MLPPKLYQVVFYQVSLVNRTGLTCSDFRRPVEVLPRSACCTISHVHTPWGSCNKCSSMILFVHGWNFTVHQLLMDESHGKNLLPPKLYLVVFYQVILVNRTGLTCSDFRRPVEVLLGSACYTLSHFHTPWGNCNKCYSMIVSVKDSVS